MIEKLEEAIKKIGAKNKDSDCLCQSLCPVTKCYTMRLIQEALTAIKERDEKVVEALKNSIIVMADASHYEVNRERFDEALSLLQDQPCQTCGGSGKIKRRAESCALTHRLIPCPNCQMKESKAEQERQKLKRHGIEYKD